MMAAINRIRPYARSWPKLGPERGAMTVGTEESAGAFYPAWDVIGKRPTSGGRGTILLWALLLLDAQNLDDRAHLVAAIEIKLFFLSLPAARVPVPVAVAVAVTDLSNRAIPVEVE